MPQQACKANEQAALPLFELLDWWQLQRLADQTGLKPDRVKYLARRRKAFNELADAVGHKALTSEQQQILEIFANTLSFAESRQLEKLLPRDIDGFCEKR